MKSDSEQEGMFFTPPMMPETAHNANLELIPHRSRQVYELIYSRFMEWRNVQKVTSVSESVLMEYFEHMAAKVQPSTLWSQYSMLKATLRVNENIDISKYSNLISYLKQKNKGYRPKKSKILSKEEINRFLTEAPDEKYLMTKIALIFGIAGALGRDELAKVKIGDITDLEHVLLITINDTKKQEPRSFTITGEYYLKVYRKYVALRPPNMADTRFFIKYQNGKCHHHVVGIHKLASTAQEVASYLKLPDCKLYTGHSLRRTSATLLADAGADITALMRQADRTTKSATDESPKEEKAADILFINIGDTHSQTPSTSGFSDRNKEHNERVYNSDDDEDESYLEGPDEEEIDLKDLDAERISSEIIKLQANFPQECNETSVNTPSVGIKTNPINRTTANTKQYPTTIECNLFGEYISKHLQELPLDIALKLQYSIHNLVMKTRLEYARQNPDEAPSMVKQEVRDEEEMEQICVSSNTDSNKQQDIQRPEKRQSDPEFFEAKRQKPSNSPTAPNTESSSQVSQSQQMKGKRTNCVIFAEQIAIQLEQLPEELALQLQLDIYAMITKASEKYDPSGGIRIKAEDIEVPPELNEYYEG